MSSDSTALGDLITFLNARLDEDEAALRAIEDSSEPWRGQWAPDDMNFALRTRNGWSLARAVTVEEGFPSGVLAHIARHDPARVLREVEAKRAIIRAAFAHEAKIDGEWGCCHEAGEIAAGKCPDIRPDDIDILRILAAVYSDHADYRPEWKQED